MHGQETFSERESHERFTYQVNQRYAPIIKGRLPSLDLFRAMLCHDISVDGLSFYWRWMPEFDELVLELTANEETKYLRATVSGCTLDIQKNEYLVRCQFTNRVATLPE